MLSGQSVAGRQNGPLWGLKRFCSVSLDIILELGLGGREESFLDRQQMSEGVRVVAL